MTYRQCPSCGGECKKSGCERADVVDKEWVGLTDHEVVMLGYQSNGNECDAIRLAEAKLKEKNT